MKLKNYLNFIIVLSLSLFYSCSAGDSTYEEEIIEETKSVQTIEKNPNLKVRPALQMNKSLAEAKILEVRKGVNLDYEVVLEIISAVGIEGLPNLLVNGNTIVARPSFILNEDSKIDLKDLRNQNLLTINNLSQNTLIKAILFYDLNKGWFISDLVK